MKSEKLKVQEGKDEQAARLVQSRQQDMLVLRFVPRVFPASDHLMCSTCVPALGQISCYLSVRTFLAFLIWLRSVFYLFFVNLLTLDFCLISTFPVFGIICFEDLILLPESFFIRGSDYFT